MPRRTDISHFLKRTYAGLALLARRFRVNSVLAMWALPDRIRRVSLYLQQEVPKRQLIPATVVMVSLVTMTTMYVYEHRSHNQLRSTYRETSISARAEQATMRHTLSTLLDEQAGSIGGEPYNTCHISGMGAEEAMSPSG